MRIAVIQHRLRESAAKDVEALLSAARIAADGGAELIVMPELRTMESAPEDLREELHCKMDDVAATVLFPRAGLSAEGVCYVASPLEGHEALGNLGLLVGDAAFSSANWSGIVAQEPSVLVMCPRSESDLQAEATIELAIALSESLAGVVLLAECDGADAGDAGHGGSVIVVLGDIVAEASAGDDVLFGDVELPLRRPEPREPLPVLPTILAQRIANHHGEKLAVDYPADLSDGSGPR